MGRLGGRHCNSCSDACVNFNLKALYVVCPPRPAPSGRDGLPGPSVLCVSNSESYCVRRSRGYFNCLANGELFKLDGLLLPVSVSQIAGFALRDQGPVRCHSICCWVSGPAPCCFFFRSAGFYTAISCQPKDKLTDISVDCVVSIPYRSVRKKKERNKKYYACNSEQLRKKHAGLLLNSIKHAKSSQLEAKSDFGKGCHTRSTEPYFYEAAYLYVRDSLSL